MIRGKKIRINKRVYYDYQKINGKTQKTKLGYIKIDTFDSYVIIDGITTNISYRLKKHADDYNQAYLARKMRALFLAEYNRPTLEEEIHIQDVHTKEVAMKIFNVQQQMNQIMADSAPIGYQPDLYDTMGGM